MSLFNWIFIKKALFTGGVVGIGFTPVIAIHSYGSASGHLDISDLKKGMEYLTGKYASQFGIEEFSKEIFGVEEMHDSIHDVFAQDLGYLAIMKTSAYSDQMQKFISDEESSFNDAFSSYKSNSKQHIQTFYDSKGGDRESMKRRNLTNQAFEIFRKEIMDFDSGNFTMNKASNSYTPIRKLHHISKTLLDAKDNRKHIGFFAHELDTRYSRDPEFYKSKFDFINFAHKRWFDEVRPFYAWMSLWKYKEKVSKSELMSVYDEEKLKESKVDIPNRASYEFPLYSQSSTQKFKDFFKDRVTGYNNNLFIPAGYTDDSASSILVEGSKMYGNLYVKFAAAANYKYQKKLQKLKNSSESSKNINEREKNHNVSSYKSPTELFQFSNSDSNNNSEKSRIPIKKDLLKNSDLKNKNEISDLVEIKNTPWVFIRNQAGIHAIALDIENMGSSDQISDIYGYFQYRTLQMKYKKELGLSQVLDADLDSVIVSFQNYLKENFSRLILKYAYSSSQKPQSGFFGIEIPKEVSLYKEVFEQLEQLLGIKNIYLFRRKLRESLINTYSKYKWNVKSDADKSFDYADPNLGLAGINPYKIKSDNNKGSLIYVFEELEKLFDFSLFDHGKTSNTKSLVDQYIDEKNKVTTNKDKYIEQLQISLTNDDKNLYSKRVFANNYYINLITDKLLERTELFNELLYKYILKSDYLGTGPLGNKGFIKTGDYFGIEVPDSCKQDSGSSVNGGQAEIITSYSGSNNTDENCKKLLSKIDSYITNAYYSKQLLEKESSNPWDAMKYDGNLIKEISTSNGNSLQDQLQDLSQRVFKEHMVFGISNYRQKHYKFLNTLTYLIKDDFKGLLNYLSSNISYHIDSYIIFSNISTQENKLDLPEKKFSNPYLDRSLKLTENKNKEKFKKSTDNIFGYLSGVNFKDSKSKVSQNFIYTGLYTNKSTSFSTISEDDRKKINAKSLYRYGSDKSSMNKYVLEINSEDELKKVIGAVKDTVTGDDSDWTKNLDITQIYVDSSVTNTLKTLTLQERKNLLSAYLNNVKVEISNSKIDKNKYKSVFLSDPDNSYNLTTDKHIEKQNSDSNYEEKLKKDSHFKKNEDIKDGTNTRHKLFQINRDHVSSFEKFKQFVNTDLGSPEVFWTWIINLALDQDIQNMSLKEMSNISTKISPYDSKWVESGKSEFVRK